MSTTTSFVPIDYHLFCDNFFQSSIPCMIHKYIDGLCIGESTSCSHKSCPVPPILKISGCELFISIWRTNNPNQSYKNRLFFYKKGSELTFQGCWKVSMGVGAKIVSWYDYVVSIEIFKYL